MSSVHSVHFYEDSTALISRLCAVVSSSLRTGDSVLIVATSKHRDLLTAALRSCGLDVREHARERRYSMLDASETLATFMRDGMPDAKLFAAVVGEILDEVRSGALARGKDLTVFGEMVAILWEEGKKQAALQLESLWNDTLSGRAFHLHCAYSRRSVLNNNDLAAIQHTHSHLMQ